MEQKSLPFIEDGKTTKEEVLSRLGAPSSKFEDGRIIIYHMMKPGLFGGIEVDPDKKFMYNLILVFDKQNILQKHRMLDLRLWAP